VREARHQFFLVRKHRQAQTEKGVALWSKNHLVQASGSVTGGGCPSSGTVAFLRTRPSIIKFASGGGGGTKKGHVDFHPRCMAAVT